MDVALAGLAKAGPVGHFFDEEYKRENLPFLDEIQDNERFETWEATRSKSPASAAANRAGICSIPIGRIRPSWIRPLQRSCVNSCDAENPKCRQAFTEVVAEHICLFDHDWERQVAQDRPTRRSQRCTRTA